MFWRQSMKLFRTRHRLKVSLVNTRPLKNRLSGDCSNRTLPLYTELQVKQMNSAYYSEKAAKQIAANLGGKTYIEMDARNWVVKSGTRWSGWNAAESIYYESPLLFEGDINFEKNFEPLVMSDKDSRSVNLLVSLSKMIKKGQRCAYLTPIGP